MNDLNNGGLVKFSANFSSILKLFAHEKHTAKIRIDLNW